MPDERQRWDAEAHATLSVTLPSTVTPRAAPCAWGVSVWDMWGCGFGLQSPTGSLLSSCQLKDTWDTGCPKTGGHEATPAPSAGPDYWDSSLKGCSSSWYNRNPVEHGQRECSCRWSTKISCSLRQSLLGRGTGLLGASLLAHCCLCKPNRGQQ